MPAESDTSSLFTLPESLRESLYRVKGERRYQALALREEDYPWPCDSSAARFELIVAAICGRDLYENELYYEPQSGMLEAMFTSSDGPVRILDLGSGMTAAWCLAMAERHPEAEVIGVDLIPCELTYLPPNLTTEIHDLLEGIPFPDDYFNLVHCRDGGFSSFMENDRIDLVPDIARVLKPGGVALYENIHSMHDPFYSRTPNNPLLEVVRRRHQVRVEAQLANGINNMARRRVSLAKRVKSHEVFRDATQVVQFEKPVGFRPEAAGACPLLGPPEHQTGTLLREGWLILCESIDAAVGLDETVISELKAADRAAMPEEDQGLYVKADTIWAVKAK